VVGVVNRRADAVVGVLRGWQVQLRRRSQLRAPEN